MTVAATASPKLDRDAVATMELARLKSKPTLDGGTIEMRDRETWRSADGSVVTGVWECDAGRFHADFGAYGELFHVVGGEVTCTPDDGGEAFTLRAGDAAIFPRRWTGEWDVRSPLRKVFALWEVW